MPSTSKKQHRFMAAVANNPKFAKQVGVKQSVGEDFMKADKGRKFAKGGLTRHEDEAMDKKMVKKAVGMHDKQLHGGKKTDLAKLKKGGKVKKYEDGGMTFADMPEEDRASQARAAIDAINARQAAASEAAGGESAVRTTPRRPIAAKAPTAKPAAPKATSMSVTREELTGSPAAKPKTAGMKSLEEYSARSPWNTRGKVNIYGSSAEKSDEKSKGAVRDLYDTLTNAPRLMKKGGAVGASKRADGIAIRGKTKGKVI